MQKANKNIKLGYWGSRGRGQVSRLLLAYHELNWQNILYTDSDKWFKEDKINQFLDFPNLPYLIDGNLKISQSAAIEQYIIEKYGKSQLLGKNIQDKAIMNQMIGVMQDIRSVYGPLLIDKQYKDKIVESWKKIQPKLQYFNKFIKDKQYGLGYLSYFDFIASEISYYIATIYSQHYMNYPFLQRIRDNINSIPQIKKYYESQKSFKWPFVTQTIEAIKINL